jgi:hypothetical protein
LVVVVVVVAAAAALAAFFIRPTMRLVHNRQLILLLALEATLILIDILHRQMVVMAGIQALVQLLLSVVVVVVQYIGVDQVAPPVVGQDLIPRQLRVLQLKDMLVLMVPPMMDMLLLAVVVVPVGLVHEDFMVLMATVGLQVHHLVEMVELV